jgi:hypothetical protein
MGLCNWWITWNYYKKTERWTRWRYISRKRAWYQYEIYQKFLCIISSKVANSSQKYEWKLWAHPFPTCTSLRTQHIFIECKNSIHTSWRYKLQQKYMNGRIENSPVAGDWMVASGRRMVRVVACSRTTRVWWPEDNTSNSSGWYWQQHPKKVIKTSSFHHPCIAATPPACHDRTPIHG